MIRESAHWIRMRRDLSVAVAPVVWPAGVALAREALRRPREFHGVLLAAHARGLPQPPFDVWRRTLFEDTEFDAGLCHAAVDTQGRVVAVVHGWTSGFVKDLAVVEDHRRTGLGTALLRHALGVLRARGLHEASLKVDRDNWGARALYEREGFVPEQLPF